MISPRATVAGGDHETAQRRLGLGAGRLRRDERCPGVRTMTWRTPVCTVRSGLKCRGRLGGDGMIQPASCLRTVTVLMTTASTWRRSTHATPTADLPGLVLPVPRTSRFPAPGTTTGRYSSGENITRRSLPAEHFVTTANSPPSR